MNITVLQKQIVIQVEGTIAMTNIVPFTFTATTAGQTIFGPLPALPAALICCFITGAGQNIAAGDAVLYGATNVKLSQGVDIGDTVYGAIQI